MKIKKLEDSCYVVKDEMTNKILKLGKNEYLFLQSLREKDSSLMPENVLTEEQKTFLVGKFSELGFLNDETIKRKEKKELSNIKIINFGFSKKNYIILKVLGAFISLPGFIGFIGAFIGIVISFIFYSDVIIYGVNNISMDIRTIALLFVMILATAIMHELFHATACYKYTGEISGMGIKLFYLMPVFYTDVSTVYFSDNKKKRFIVSAAGLMCNTFLAGISLVLYIILYVRGIYCKLFFYYFVFQFATILRNLLPFEKFDAYWMVVSISGVYNLYDKSIMMFITLISNIEYYLAIPIGFIKKIVLSLYGVVNLVFRWMFWSYCIEALKRLLQIYTTEQIANNSSVLLYGAIAINSIIFLGKYIIKYKNEGRTIIMNL